MFKIFWLTGLPCSGKTTIAKDLARQLHAEILDGDEIRAIVGNQDFSPEGRAKHMRQVAVFASVLSKYNHVIVALVSPIKEIREEIKKKYQNLIEIYVHADLEVCRKRDVKGMYKLAEEGKIKNFTGVDDEYQTPGESTTKVDTTKMSVQECVREILQKHHVPTSYSLFIGRWQPLHDGHLALFDKMRQEGRKILIGIRNTGIDEKNPFSVQERIDMMKKHVPDAEVVVLPDIGAVCYGRKVGYEVKEIKLGEELESISATKIRQQMQHRAT